MKSKPTASAVKYEYAHLDLPTRRFVQERAERIHNLARMTAAGIVQIGQYLTEVKERLEHGEFLEWIEREFAWTRKTAERFMNVHEQFKMDKLSNLDIDVSALYLIAAPSTPEPVREQVLVRARNGERVTHEGARAIVKRFAETGEIPDIQKSFHEILEERRAVANIPNVRPTMEQRRECVALENEMKANATHVHAVMSVIGAIETIAHSTLTPETMATEINRYDTPDKDWAGCVHGAIPFLKNLAREL